MKNQWWKLKGNTENEKRYLNKNKDKDSVPTGNNALIYEMGKFTHFGVSWGLCKGDMNLQSWTCFVSCLCRTLLSHTTPFFLAQSHQTLFAVLGLNLWLLVHVHFTPSSLPGRRYLLLPLPASVVWTIATLSMSPRICLFPFLSLWTTECDNHSWANSSLKDCGLQPPSLQLTLGFSHSQSHFLDESSEELTEPCGAFPGV